MTRGFEDEQLAIIKAEDGLLALIPYVKDRLVAAYGHDWLAKVNERRDDPLPSDSLREARLILALIVHEPALRDAFTDDECEDARLLNNILNTAHHNNVRNRWEPGDLERTREIVERLCLGRCG